MRTSPLALTTSSTFLPNSKIIRNWEWPGRPSSRTASSTTTEFSNIEHVSGACQLFRKECYEDIGGYIPIKGGGIDTVAVRTARMKGWQTRTFTERTCFHHRKMGTGSSSKARGLFKLGKEDYYLGGHPLWQAVRSVYQLTRKPYIVGGSDASCRLYLGRH